MNFYIFKIKFATFLHKKPKFLAKFSTKELKEELPRQNGAEI